MNQENEPSCSGIFFPLMQPKPLFFSTILFLGLLCATTLLYSQDLNTKWQKFDRLSREIPLDFADSAKVLALKALNIAKQTKNPEQLARTYYRLGALSNELNDFNGAKTYLNLALTLAKNDTIKEAIYTELGRAFAEATVQYDASQKEDENQRLRNAALADDNTISNQYAIILAGSVVLILLIALVLIIGDRSKQNRLAHLKMSEQKEEIEAQRDQLEEMNRTKDRFFGIISHDMRGPVNAFQGLSALTRMYLEKGDQRRIPELIDKMDASSNRLSRLLDNLLNWALTQEGSFPYSPERFTLKDRLHEVLDIFPLSAKAKSITIEDLTDHSLAIYADPNGFKTIVRNLINNAIKYSQKGDAIKIKSFKEDELVSVQVCDTGAGMPPEQIERLFNLETNTSTPGTSGEKGSGLGLVLCQELIDLNKGKIGVKSELHKGATFTVSFPKG